MRGHLAPHATSALMKLLYGARIARFDLLRQVNRLARNVHKWSDSDDRGLHHLMCYVHHTKHWRMVGWVGDRMDDVHLALYADADFAGCVESLRSTSGGRLILQGPNTRFPLSGSSKRQSCVSHLTPEAEIVAADVAMRAMGLPALKLLQRILKKSPNFVFYDDNKAMIGVVRPGRNPTMRILREAMAFAFYGCMRCSRVITCIWRTKSLTAWQLTSTPRRSMMDANGNMHACRLVCLTRVCCLIRIPSRRSHLRVIPSKGPCKQLRGWLTGVPTFPYTHIPVMPPDLWWPGLKCKEGLHEHDGHDPVVVAKGPRLMRVQPPLAVETPFRSKWLRSTWFLKNGSWLKVEDRVDPGLQCERIDGWVERTVWQFHPVPVAAPDLRDHDQFTLGPVKQIRRLYWPHLSRSCQTNVLNYNVSMTLLRLKLLMRCLHTSHEQFVPGRCFVPYRIAVKHKPQLSPGIELALVAHDGSVLRAPLHVSLPGMRTRTMSRPIVLLACSEPRNWFTALARHKGPQVVTVTLVDDLMSECGGSIARHVLTKSSDSLFFAGPCTGGASWARLAELTPQRKSRPNKRNFGSCLDVLWKSNDMP